MATTATIAAPVRELLHRVDAALARARSPRPVLQRQAQELEQLITRAYRKRENPLGGKWPGTKKGTESKGASETATTVAVSGESRIAIRVDVPYATQQMRKRSAVPVDASLQLRFDSGQAKVWWDETRRRIAAYILEPLTGGA